MVIQEQERKRKKVVLLGDSILCIGYGTRVAELLSDECDVWQPDDNCRFAKYTLRMLADYKEQIQGADVIHWNNGRWDVSGILGDGPFTDLDEYMANMLRIADLLLCMGKTVIFATTAPTHPEYMDAVYERTKEYNAALVPELQKKGVLINDLFSLMDAHRFDGICEDKIHLSELGIELCANKVVEAIKNAL